MNGTAFWSGVYGIASRKRTGLSNAVVSFVFKPLTLGVRLARKFNVDPIVKVRVGDRALFMPWSHNLPSILESCPTYETEMGRLAMHLSKTDGEVLMIDVGANIGDTIARLPALDQAKFLCIEGSERYYDLLRKNYESDARVTLLFALLTDVTGQADGAHLKEVEGTAHLEMAKGSVAAAPWLTLDELLGRYPAFANANLIKIDTDGYELRVLRGATAFLERAKPCLHIEVAPHFWREYGGCEVSDALVFLSRFGYKEVLVYDNYGYFIGRDGTQNPKFLSVLADYAVRRRRWFYMNLIVFHERRKDIEQFYGRETSEANGKIE
jgi:FkbM family methyltransferase